MGLEVVEDSGHMATLEEPGKIADLLESCLTG